MTWKDGPGEEKPWEADTEHEQWLPKPPTFGSQAEGWQSGVEEEEEDDEAFDEECEAEDCDEDEGVAELGEMLGGLLRYPLDSSLDALFMAAVAASLPDYLQFNWRETPVSVPRVYNCVYMLRCPACHRLWLLDLSGRRGKYTLLGGHGTPTIRPALECPWRSSDEGPVCTWRAQVSDGLAIDLPPDRSDS